jgi:TonB family protein
MFRLLATALFLVPATALAQQAPAASAPVQAAATTPLHNDCTHLYPQSAAQAGEEGTTVVSVNIAIDGTMTAPHVARSSGYPDLDNAALICVNGAHVKPLTNQGVPIAVVSEVEVAWHRSSFRGAPAALEPNICSYRYYPLVAVRLNHQGEVELTFTIAADGSAKNIKVAKSSGYDELDKAAAACVSGFRHWPSTEQGHGVEIDGTTKIVWKLGS